MGIRGEKWMWQGWWGYISIREIVDYGKGCEDGIAPGCDVASLLWTLGCLFLTPLF